ncbi:MAG: rod shape-determining protein RodA [Bacteroidetes bacterium]|nr:MAG: rod shape-determining protein RodA [Bacteroidota bacterium]MBL1143878.1 rod shape-determining protein RodA [Bacteroidota bacterium]MCB0801512.1 rod shape-determining protein RodA [Flavobacteriales bacterium]NOG56679.1 rod shape-determining protein RodA [Bacteroidota bacterium]
MRGNRKLIDNIDWMLVSIYFILIIAGWLNIYAAVYNEEFKSIFDTTQSYGKQLIWIGTATAIATIILLIDERFFATFGYFIYGIIILLLIIVIVIGTETKGATSWFEVGGFKIQPSEFAKFATNLALAKFLSTLNIKMSDLKTKLIAIFIIGLPAILILLQNDTGSALVYAAFVFVLYREGLSGSFLVIGLVTAFLFVITLVFQNEVYHLPFEIEIGGNLMLVLVLALILAAIYYFNRKKKKIILLLSVIFIASIGLIKSVDYVFTDVLSPHQSKRINVMLGLESDPKGAGYNVNQSLIAIGSGGFSGKGFLQGTQTKYDFVPEQSTDFIFCTIGEEWGFLGSIVVIALFMTLLLRILFLCSRQRSSFARIYGYGVASILFFHFTINIGMTIGLVPVIGIPLPFFSYGGSSLWGFTILLFVFIRMDADRLDVL